MMPILFMANEDRSALLPANDAAEKVLRALAPGASVPIDFPETDTRRQLRRHVFGVLGRVAKTLGVDAEELRVIMLIRTGRAHVLQTPLTRADASGKPLTEMRNAVVVESMARQLMDEDELRAFYKEMRSAIIEQMLPETPEPDRSEIAALLDAQ